MTIYDVHLADNIFGPGIGALKGNSTGSKLKPAKDDLMEIPTELTEKQEDMKKCMDIMFVNEITMLTVINKTINYQSLVCMNSRSEDELYKGIDKIFR